MEHENGRMKSAAARKHRSLAARVSRATVLNCAILGLVALLLGLSFYTVASAQKYVSQAFNYSVSAKNSVVRGANGAGLADQVMEIYRSLTPEERAAVGTEEYHARFSRLQKEQDFITEWHILSGVYEANANEVSNIYLGMFDRETGALVHIVDRNRDLNDYRSIGGWESVDSKEIEHFLSWKESDTGMLYDIDHTAEKGWFCTAAIPRWDENGIISFFVFTEVTLGGLIADMRAFVIQFTLALLLVTVLITLLSAKRIKKELVEPVNAIAEAARRYSADKKEGVAKTEHFSRLDIRTGDEVENLSRIMADMERNLFEYEQNLTAVTAEKERIATELNLAADIQAHMLPSTFPAFPGRAEFDIYASMAPAKEVGGDFYDFFLVDEDHLALVIADVSGKGVPAALFMMASRTMLKDAALSGMDPAAVLARVNRQLCENNPDMMFVTVWLGILEIPTGLLVWADAGHERLCLFRNGRWECLPKKGGVALAAFEPEQLGESAFRNSELQLCPGDVLFQYTDGVTEAMTAEREQFGTDRLLEALKSAPSADPESLLPHVRAQMDAFVQGAPQFDDITMLSLRYRGACEGQA